jgi:energy-coupling factor transporter ATP-binding protein EcfA2
MTHFEGAFQRNEVLLETNGHVDGSPQRIKLLNDSPSEADVFKSQAHSRIALGISQIVSSESGGSVIGLEGPWGSGKSTIISILKGKLEAESNIDLSSRVFVFDAWAHEGDPLRRSFLEQLIHQLRAWVWINESDKKKAVDELTGRVKSERSKSLGRLTPEGQFASGAALLVPIGASIFSGHFVNHHALYVTIGTLMLLAPAIVVASFAISTVFAKLKVKALRKNGQVITRRLRKKSQRPFASFISRDQRTEILTESIESDEPTSVEFEKIFNSQMELALTSDRRLVIVFDNLDRINGDDAMSLLSTMQTFVSNSLSKRREDWAQRLWVLLPYDRDSLSRLWSDSIGSGKNPSASQSKRENSYLDKIFQTRFTVPKLLFSHWRDFLRMLLHEAFVGADDDELARLIHIKSISELELANSQGKEDPTPRELTLYVNEIGSFARLHSDMPLAHIAYFLHLKQSKQDLEELLLNNVTVPANFEILLDDQVNLDIGALYFGCDQESGRQFLIQPQLDTALRNGDSKAVGRLSELNGFFDALDAMDLIAWSDHGGVELLHAIAALDECRLFGNREAMQWFRRAVLPLTKTTAEWILADEIAARGLASICSLNDDVGQVTSLFSKIRPLGYTPDAPPAQIVALGELGSQLIRREISLSNLSVDIEFDDAKLVEFASEFAESVPVEAWGLLHLKTNTADTANQYIALISSNAYDPETIDSASRLLLSTGLTDLESIVRGAINSMRSLELPLSQFGSVTGVLLSPNAASALQGHLAEIAADGLIVDCFIRSVDFGLIDFAASFSLLFLAHQSAVTGVPNFRQAPQGLETLRLTLSNPENYENLMQAQTKIMLRDSEFWSKRLMEILDTDTSARQWIRKQLNSLAKDDEFEIDGNAFVERWTDMGELLDRNEFKLVLKQLLSQPSKRSELILIVKNGLQLDSIIELSNSDDVGLRSNQYVSDASKDMWTESLLNGDPDGLIKLSLDLIRLGRAPHATIALQDALFEMSEKLALAEVTTQVSGDDLDNLISLLPDELSGILGSRICLMLDKHNGNFDFSVIQAFGVFLSHSKEFLISSSLPNVIGGVVSSEKWDHLEWFAATASLDQIMLNESGRSNEINGLKLRVKEKRDSLLPEVPLSLQTISDLLEKT